ncbi:methyltransferase domain-containing protein, partial [Toxoplasma gondii VAND]
LLGIRSLRKQLVTRAQGDVLEVAAGTGRNFRFYDPAKVKSLVVTDFSRLMLRKALEKKAQKMRSPDPVPQATCAMVSPPFVFACVCVLSPYEKEISEERFQICSVPAEALRGIPAEFKLQNSAKMKFPDESFDAVVDTFGVCSYEKPVETLQELKRVIKPGGALLLLEHGESSWIYFQKKLERSLLRHVWKFGCYHNRPIRQLVNDAGFDVVFEKRRVFGTIYLIVARKPAKEHVRQLLDRKEEE